MSTVKILVIGTLICIAAYLFATAPPELTDQGAADSASTAVATTRLFNAANAINDAARLVYTKRIVGGGSAAGLQFRDQKSKPPAASAATRNITTRRFTSTRDFAKPAMTICG